MWTVYTMLKPESCFLQCGVKWSVLKLLGELLVQQWFSWNTEAGKGEREGICCGKCPGSACLKYSW